MAKQAASFIIQKRSNIVIGLLNDLIIIWLFSTLFVLDYFMRFLSSSRPVCHKFLQNAAVVQVHIPSNDASVDTFHRESLQVRAFDSLESLKMFIVEIRFLKYCALVKSLGDSKHVFWLPALIICLDLVLDRPLYGVPPRENTSQQRTPKLQTSHSDVYFP